MPGEKILIIEDNELNLELVKILLEKSGYEVLASTRADDGITKAKTDKPDLILMDMRLPGMNGMQAVKLLKEEESTRDIPVVILTGDVMLQSREKALENGFAGYIAKPINTRQFGTMVADYLSS
jgi:CheY-like chemotaxis protein